mmetsp:Transcript_13106/g.24003  ORF Transcript_13106/g.24003 Transcript_13106/m.24003 type:complete len:357 (+) Transcript_13106:720-1790(+)
MLSLWITHSSVDRLEAILHVLHSNFVDRCDHVPPLCQLPFPSACLPGATPFTRSAADDVVHTQNHLCRFSGIIDHAALVLPGLQHSGLCGHIPLVHIKACLVVAIVVLRDQPCDELRRVQTGVVTDDGRDLAQGPREGLHGQGLLARRALGLLLHGLGHHHLTAPRSQHRAGFLDGLGNHAEGIVEGALSFIQHVLRGPSQHHRAGLSPLAAREPNDRVLSDHNLVDQGTLAQLHFIRMVEGGRHFTSQHQRQPLNPIEVRMFDGHDIALCKQLLRVIVDQLPVDEAVDAVVHDLLAFLLHLLLLRLLNLREFCDGIHPHAGPENLDLIRVHGGVGDQDLGVLQPLGLPKPNLLRQ